MAKKKNKEKKELVSCRVTREEFVLLERIVTQQNSNRTQVVEQACQAFFEYYKERGSLPREALLSAPQVGETYRGYIPASLKEEFYKLATSTRHPESDLHYSALRHLIASQNFGEHTFLTCFLPVAIHEQCEKECEERGLDRAELARESASMLLNWYRSSKKPKDWRVPPVSLQGQPFEAYVSSDVLGDLQKIAVEQTCSPVAVFRESLMHRFEEPEPEEKVMAEGLILDTFAQELGRYARAKGYTYSEVMQQACQSFLGWFKEQSEETLGRGWQPPSVLSGTPVRGYVDQELMDELEAIPHVTLDLISLAIMHYIHEQEIHQVALFIDEEMEARKLDQTPGISSILLLKEQDKLIRLLAVTLNLDSTTDFYMLAARWWLTQREQHQGAYPYTSRLTDKYVEGEEEPLVTANLVIDRAVHERFVAQSAMDGRSIRTLYYNAVVSYLDYVMEAEQDVISLQNLYKKTL